MDTPTPPMGAAAHTQAQARPSDAVAADEASRDPLSEQQIALEQWLHQVPDDPAGLLRRKFMLEHLLRQKGHRTP
jgi:Ca-activated chloride channel family protein